MAIVGKTSITSIEYTPAQRSDGDQIQGIRPPDTLHREAVDIRANNLIARGQQKPQVVQKFGRVESQTHVHPWFLQSGNFYPAPA